MKPFTAFKFFILISPSNTIPHYGEMLFLPSNLLLISLHVTPKLGFKKINGPNLYLSPSNSY